MIRTRKRTKDSRRGAQPPRKCSPNSPVLAAALLWDAWETNPPLARQAWLGPLLVSATLRERQKTRAHLVCVNLGLRCVPREKTPLAGPGGAVGRFPRGDRGRGGGGDEGP